jgi:hypothetical protein
LVISVFVASILAQEAGEDPIAASLIANLPRVLDNLGTEPLVNLAQGCNYLVGSEADPTVGQVSRWRLGLLGL